MSVSKAAILRTESAWAVLTSIPCRCKPNGYAIIVPGTRRHKSSASPSTPPLTNPSQLTPSPLRTTSPSSAGQIGGNGNGDGDNDGAPTLVYLSRALGQRHPPRADQNTGINSRTLEQRRADLADKQKNLERREELLKELNRGYFNEWRDMKHHQGKTWIAPPRIFRGDRAGYMPNLYGRTVAKGKEGKGAATTDALKNKVSIVSVYSSAWAQRQAESFTGPKANAELHEIVKQSGGRAQQVVVNISFSWIKSLLLRLFTWRLRRQLPREMHSKYFLVRKGFTRDLAAQMGMSNLSVGHT
ncbi:Mitochondrial ATPase complex subunit atp10, partial [Ascosphaera pollenicola]